MKSFLDEDFLLTNSIAKKIYRQIEKLPIIDYHCHLNPQEIAENKRYKNITELWLYGDHYKWRLMRANGIEEEFITGVASDYDKFLMWATTIGEAIGNPIYHWTHLELKRYFNYEGLLNKKTALEVWNHCNKIIDDENFSVDKILKNFNIEILCTTDDPIDDLFFHEKIKNNSMFTTKVLPTFRPSNALNIESINFIEYLKKLELASGQKINNYDDIVNALYKRIDFFNKIGCRLSDHSLDPIVFEKSNSIELNYIFKNKIENINISQIDINKYKTALFHDLCLKYNELNWTLQMHLNCIRNVNTRMFNILGSDTGYDCISDFPISMQIIKTLDSLDKKNKLPKTILYSLNPNDNDMLTTIIGCFQGGGIKGKIQLGSAWWFNDSLIGMKNQMSSLANNGLLSRFIGMLTDSRSFLSYPRHEYFRRILSNFIANYVETNQFPNDLDLLFNIASNICYYNAKEYFNF